MKLVVAEKPSVAMSIAKVLGATHKGNGYYDGNGYIVSWCIGHLVELAPPQSYGEQYADKQWRVESLPIIPSEWKFGVNSKTKNQFLVLRGLMTSDSVSEIVCATDAGREGECIFRYVYNLVRCKKPIYRLWISSLEESAINAGFQNLRPSQEFDRLFSSGLCRAKADWLVGINGTRLFSALYHRLLSIGRVQTPTLAMIVERDHKIKNFIKEKYFKVQLKCGTFTADSERIDEEKTATQLAAACQRKDARVADLKKEQKTVAAPKLYDLTTLQREANRLFSFSAQKTLDTAQALYEKKLITYPRTDSQYLTEDMLDTAQQILNIIIETMPFIQEFDSEICMNNIIKNAGVTDHHALIPTMELANADLSILSDEEQKILMMIANRLVCAVSNKYIYEAITVLINCGNHLFTAKGKKDLERGWKACDVQLKTYLHTDREPTLDDEQQICATTGDIIHCPAVSVLQFWTSPPKHYTEDTLLSAMETAGNTDYKPDSDVEKKGLGTPATRANIIETLVRREYIERKGKNLLATEKGAALIQIIPETVKSAKLTADWEQILQGIEKGTINADSFMQDITAFVTQLVAENASVNAETSSLFQKQQTACLGNCPKCGAKVQKGKYGYYCTEKCGMQLAKIYGKALTETQLQHLLSGQEISITLNKKIIKILPEYTENKYTDSNGTEHFGFQWKTSYA